MFDADAYRRYLDECRRENTVAENVHEWAKRTCEYCTSINAMTGVRHCPIHGHETPPIAGAADPEYSSRLDAAARHDGVRYQVHAPDRFRTRTHNR